jgi:hypothetical protein
MLGVDDGRVTPILQVVAMVMVGYKPYFQNHQLYTTHDGISAVSQHDSIQGDFPRRVPHIIFLIF